MSAIGEALNQMGMSVMEIVNQMSQNGWTYYIFPFFITYIIMINLTDKVSFFEGKKKKAHRVLISVAISIFAVSFPIANNVKIADIMNSLFPGVTAFSIALLGIYIVLGMMNVNLFKIFGETFDTYNIKLKLILVGIGVTFVLAYFLKGLDISILGLPVISWLSDPVLYILITIGIIFYYLNIDEGDEDSAKYEFRSWKGTWNPNQHEQERVKHMIAKKYKVDPDRLN